MHFAARFNGKSYAEFASDYRILVQCNIKALEYFNLDWVGLISDPYRETSAFGAKLEYVPEGVPKCLGNIIKTLEDVKKLKNPDVYGSDRTLDRIKGAELYQKLLKNEVPVFGWIEGPLAEACDLAGVSEMLVQLMIDPDFSNLLMDKCVSTAKEFAKAQINAGCDVIGIGDAICSQISFETYDVYVKDRHIEIINYIHSLGSKAKLHICGDITHLLPALKNLHPDILDIDWQVDFETAHKIMGDNTVICGNINPVLIQDCKKEEIYKLSKRLIKAEEGKKFILSGGCEITVLTPVENLKSMGEACK